MLHGAEPGNEQFKAYFEDGSEEIFQTWDYANIYSHPHLYEILFCDTLKLGAYKNLGILLARNVDADETKLSVLDVACGSGLMGKFLIKETALNIDHLVGVDIAPEAIAALNRDCPGVYSEAMTVDEFYNRQEQHKSHFNCLAVSGGAYKIGAVSYTHLRAHETS